MTEHSANPTYLLGHAPVWYKWFIVLSLMLNAVVLNYGGPYVAGWLVLLEFIVTLVFALNVYPLVGGGLIALQAVALGLTSTHTWFEELKNNFSVFLLLMFMVAAVYFHRELLEYIFAKLLTRTKSKVVLSVSLCTIGAVLSAFLDALTVMAVFITAVFGLHSLYLNARHSLPEHDETAREQKRVALLEFRNFLCDISMHMAIGTMLGGVSTLVGEPQNLLIGNVMGWQFGEFFTRMLPISLPVFLAGLVVCGTLEGLRPLGRIFGYGTALPSDIRWFFLRVSKQEEKRANRGSRYRLTVQSTTAALLVTLLATQWAEVGVIGLTILVLVTAFNGKTHEHDFGPAFNAGMPFCALLAIFFAIIAVIHEQHLFNPIISWVMSFPREDQAIVMYFANGLLSAVSDNVFVATIYISEVSALAASGAIDRAHAEALAIAINAGTNIPSIATPNGQAAFLFLLTSELAVAIGLRYFKMLWMAVPYTIVLTIVGWLAL